MIVENQMGVKVHMTEGGYTNIKITHPSAAQSVLIPSENFLKTASLDFMC